MLLLKWIEQYKIKRHVARLKKRMKDRLGNDCYIPLNCRLIGLDLMTIGDSFYAYDDLRIEVFNLEGRVEKAQLQIGDNVAVGKYCHIGVINKVIIGNDVLMGSNVLITDHMHGEGKKEDIILPPNKRPLFSKGPVIIEDCVFIGDGVKIMPDVRIGKNAIIGANSVITHDVPAYSVVAGNPAHIIRKGTEN